MSRLTAIATLMVGRTIALQPTGQRAVVIGVDATGLTIRRCDTGETSSGVPPGDIHHWCDEPADEAVLASVPAPAATVTNLDDFRRLGDQSGQGFNRLNGGPSRSVVAPLSKTRPPLSSHSGGRAFNG